MTNKRIFVLPDTNILMRGAAEIEPLFNRGFCVVVPVTVLSELDKYKHHKEKGYNVRKVSRLIEAADKRNDGSIELTINTKRSRILTGRSLTTGSCLRRCVLWMKVNRSGL